MDSSIIWTVIAAFVGALGCGIAGWADSHGPFDWHIFMGTVWRALFAAMVFMSTFQAANLTGWQIYVAAFLGGAGVDAVGNRIQGGLSAKDTTADKLKELESKLTELVNERTKLPEA